jgi:hypothetical protein
MAKICARAQTRGKRAQSIKFLHLTPLDYFKFWRILQVFTVNLSRMDTNSSPVFPAVEESNLPEVTFSLLPARPDNPGPECTGNEDFLSHFKDQFRGGILSIGRQSGGCEYGIFRRRNDGQNDLWPHFVSHLNAISGGMRMYEWAQRLQNGGEVFAVVHKGNGNGSFLIRDGGDGPVYCWWIQSAVGTITEDREDVVRGTRHIWHMPARFVEVHQGSEDQGDVRAIVRPVEREFSCYVRGNKIDLVRSGVVPPLAIGSRFKIPEVDPDGTGRHKWRAKSADMQSILRGTPFKLFPDSGIEERKPADRSRRIPPRCFVKTSSSPHNLALEAARLARRSPKFPEGGFVTSSGVANVLLASCNTRGLSLYNARTSVNLDDRSKMETSFHPFPLPDESERSTGSDPSAESYWSLIGNNWGVVRLFEI